ncbi:hypothetical protein [Bacterioplanoides sp.]|uniref:hypothetical protein n=1 Tax=Bacterioplanoides sp. TaxID=2066072 RepID=UPI003B58D49F
MTAKKYGINERKKADISALTDDVEVLEYQLRQQQAVVDELSEKATEFSAQLADAEKKRDQAARRSDMVIEAASNVRSIMHKASMVQKQTGKSGAGASKTLVQMKTLVQQVIFSADLVGRLVVMVQKKKSAGALISSELIRVLDGAAKDADGAVSSTLKALTSCYNAVAETEDSTRLTHQELHQSIELYTMISGDKNILEESKKLQQQISAKEHNEHSSSDGIADQEKAIRGLMNKVETSIRSFGQAEPDNQSLLGLVSQASRHANRQYDLAQAASGRASRELEEAKTKLARTSVNLESLQAGLSAADAAAALI